MSFSRDRTDARPQNSWTTQVGLRNVHSDTRGRPISGRWDSGKPWTPGKTAEGGTTASAPVPDAVNVNGRQNLYKRIMAGGQLTPAMREEGKRLGVIDDQFNAAAEQAKTNARYTPAAKSQGWASTATGAAATPAQPAATKPTAPAPPTVPGLTPQITTSTGPGNAPVVNGRAINRLTGKPMGWVPGDDTPAPRYGKDIANANIASKGVAGAIADYQNRSNQDASQKMTAKLNATGNPTPSLQQRMSPVPLQSKTWQQTAGINPPKSPTATALPVSPAKPAPITPIQPVIQPPATPSPTTLPPMPAVAAEKPKPPVDPATAALNLANKSAALQFAQGKPQAAASNWLANKIQ